MKALATTVFLLVASTAALAGHGPGGERRAEHREHMRQALGLSSEQVEQMQEIRDQGGSREDMREVLTEEQQVKAEEMRQRHKGHRAKRFARMLNLSDEQMAEIREIREQGGSREDIHAVFTDEQKALAEEMHKSRRHADDNTL